MRNLDLQLRLTALDRGTAPIQRFSSTLDGLKTRFAGAEQAALATGHATDRAGRDIAELGRAADRADGPLTRLWRRLETIGRSRGTAALKGASAGLLSLGRGAAGMAGTAAAVGGGAAAFGLGQFGRGVIKTGSDFEGYRELLTVLEKSEAGAKRALDWVDKFATTTPNRIDEVIKAYVKLRNAGVDPTDGTLKALGEASAVFTPLGKSLDDVVEALADARMGEFERLKEFGISASQTGKKVTLSMGKVRVETTKDADAIQKAIVGIFNDRYSGAMARQAGTLAGMLSMLADRWTNFERTVADKGVFGWVKRQLGDVLNWLDKAAANGSLDRWAAQLSVSLVEVGTSLAKIGKAVDWVQLAADIGTVARVIAFLAEGLTKLQKIANRPIAKLMIPTWGIGSMVKDGLVQLATPGKPRAPVELPRRVVPGTLATTPGQSASGPGAPPVKVTGKLQVILPPGLKIVQNMISINDDHRRGMVGDRP